MLKEIPIKTSVRNELIDITSKIQAFVKESKIENGLCVVYCPHTTAGITVNENADPDVKEDLLLALEKIVPNVQFKHSEGNSDSHLKALITGTEKTFIIEKGNIVLGTWQGIMFLEADGPRNRKIIVKIIKD